MKQGFSSLVNPNELAKNNGSTMQPRRLRGLRRLRRWLGTAGAMPTSILPGYDGWIIPG